MGHVQKMWPVNSSTRYLDSVVSDNTDWDSGLEKDHEASGLYCFSEATGKVKSVTINVTVGHTDIVMELDTGASCSTLL